MFLKILKMTFDSKVVIVTGSSCGIGAATAKLFAKEGARVVLVGRNERKLANAFAELKQVGKEPHIVIADVSKDDEARTIIDQTIAKFGKLDVLVNNAGIAVDGTIMSGDILSAYDAIMATNLRAVVNLTSLAAPHLAKTKGNIVNVSSICGKRNLSIDGLLAYETSKAGLNHFTRGSALELSKHGVRVNTVSPGPVRTDVNVNCDTGIDLEQVGRACPLKRICDPEEIGDLILFLASDKAKGITGSDFVIDNGALLGLINNNSK